MIVSNSYFQFIANTEEDKKYMRQIFNFLMIRFYEIFGNKSFESEYCLVENKPDAESPMLIINATPIKIRTSVCQLSYWSQYIYQLSHELTHYVIRQNKLNKNLIIKWFEETICEAMSLYILNWCSEHWSKCELSCINPDYHTCIQNYYQDIYNDTIKSKSDSKLQQCQSLSDLQTIENTSEDKRFNRTFERNLLVDAFIKHPNDIGTFVTYTLYMQNSLLIDFSKWKENDNSPLVPILESIQPIIKPTNK